MKKLLTIIVVLNASFAMASYTNFVGDGGISTVGNLTLASNWPGFVLPSGSVTGVVVLAENVWVDLTPMWDLSVRLEGGRVFAADVPPKLTMQGGFSDPGVASIFEIDTSDYASGVTNLDVGELAMWSRVGGDMELSILNGRVNATTLTLLENAGTVGTINMGNGILHADTMAQASINVNMLSNGTGSIVCDSIPVSAHTFFLNFDSSNVGSFTFGDRYDFGTGTLVPADGLWQWLIGNGNVSVDGVANTNLSSYNITSVGWESKIRLPGALDPEEKYAVWVEGFGLSATNVSGATTNDFDLDGLENLTEYALGGNPTNSADAADINPTISGPIAGASTMDYVYKRHIDGDLLGLSYALSVTTDDLTVATWTSLPVGALETGSGPIDASFESVTNGIPTETSIGFINLEVTSTF